MVSLLKASVIACKKKGRAIKKHDTADRNADVYTTELSIFGYLKKETMTTEKLNLLNKIVDNYSDQEKENFEIYYLRGLIKKIAENEIEERDILVEEIDSIIERLPEKINSTKLVYDRKLLNNISNLKSYVREKYNFVPKGYYKKKYLAIGIALGPFLGLLFGALNGNTGIGLPFGISTGLAIGVATGANLDKKAIIENRVITE